MNKPNQLETKPIFCDLYIFFKVFITCFDVKKNWCTMYSHNAFSKHFGKSTDLVPNVTLFEKKFNKR